ncbi:hypothetical protein DL768_010863 [Monosporascus sp. mg162]|nr:hypothetical protein DL768_010863 [Monosporascus sp. mg162]
MSLTDWRSLGEVHIIGCFLLTRAAVRVMDGQDAVMPIPTADDRPPVRGAIVMLTLLASEVAFLGVGNYTAAKHAVERMVQTAAIENAARGIRVNAAAPSYVAGPMTDQFLEASSEVKRILPGEVADAVAFLASPASGYLGYAQPPVASQWPGYADPTSQSLEPTSSVAKRQLEDGYPTEGNKRHEVNSSVPDMISLLSDDEDDDNVNAQPTAHFDSSPAYAAITPSDFISTVSSQVATPATNPMGAAKALSRAAIVKRSGSPLRGKDALISQRKDVIHYAPLLDPIDMQISYDAHDSDTIRIPDLTPPPSSPNEPNAPKPPNPTLADEPPLCSEQAALVELVVQGKNVFYTGSAGCGKSTALKAIRKCLQAMGKSVRTIAPTGRAALQVNGSTTWTFAGWTPDHHKRTLDELRQAAHGKFVWKRFNETDVIIIDEISMVENLHFERLNEVMKEARHDPRLAVQPAFGGVQVIVTGDFCQLPPVRPFQYCIECGRELIAGSSDSGITFKCPQHGMYHERDKWAFRSRAWEECNFVHVQLNTIHRQSDEAFIRILQKCRIGEQLAQAETELLMDHPCMVHHATKLFATRKEADRVNKTEFERLKGLNHTYWSLDNFFWQQDEHPHLQWKGIRKPKGPQSEGPLRALEDHRFAECVELKKGMLVVLLVNLDLQSGLCNGSQGIVCGFEQNDPKKLPKAKTIKGKEPENRIFGDRAPMKEEQIKLFIQDPGASYKVWPVVKFHNGKTRTIYADCSIAELGDTRPYSLLCRTQIPLAPAWAMTIHKSQSLTLDRVIVNLSKAFEEGQVYVALSRATSLKGLKIEGDRAGLLTGLGGNQEVQEFLRAKFGGVNGPSSSICE